MQDEIVSLIGTILQSSMKESQSIVDSLRKTDIILAFEDGFRAGLSEGHARQNSEVKQLLDIPDSYVKTRLSAAFYLLRKIQLKTYPYTLLREEDTQNMWEE